jgi:hypothetical protein
MGGFLVIRSTARQFNIFGESSKAVGLLWTAPTLRHQSAIGWTADVQARSPRRVNNVPKLLGLIGPPRSEVNTCGLGPCSRCRRRSARISFPLHRVDARRAALTAPDMQAAGVQLDLVPLQIAQLAGRKPCR